jgi:hypothetical protein
MPKDATKNVDRYKIAGGHLNEYEFEHEKAPDKNQRSGKKPQSAAFQQSPRPKASKESPRTNTTKKSPTTKATKKSSKK